MHRRHPGLLPHARAPRARVDPITSEPTALALIGLVASVRPAHETVAVLLDHQRRGLDIVSVANTFSPDSVLHVADHVVESAYLRDEVAGAVIASFRPGAGDELDDLERWFTIDEQLGIAGVELVEWFVIGDGVSCPRSLVGEPARWTA